MKFRKRLILPLVLIILLLVFFLGPKPSYPSYTPQITNDLKVPLSGLESYRQETEVQIPQLKPGNGSFFYWADTVPQQTEYCILFLHGFSASPRAADPVLLDLAKKYGCNLYAPLLAGHGIDSKDSFKDISPADLVNSAKEAFQIAKKMGKKVIVAGSSTGSTLGIYLSAHNPGYADALLLYSPNIDLAAWNSKILLWPWGKQIATLISGKYYEYKKLKGTPNEQFWTTTYRIEGLIALKYLLAQTMTEEVFQKIEIPVFIGYWYKNEEIKDGTISIPRIQDFYAQISTPSAQKQMETFPEVGSHVLTCNLQCKDIPDVFARSDAFVANTLGLKPVTP